MATSGALVVVDVYVPVHARVGAVHDRVGGRGAAAGGARCATAATGTGGSAVAVSMAGTGLHRPHRRGQRRRTLDLGFTYVFNF